VPEIVETPVPDRFPECLQYWNRGDIREFPTPYYGFQTVDFVGGHTSYVYGPHVRWLETNGGSAVERVNGPGQVAPTTTELSTWRHGLPRHCGPRFAIGNSSGPAVCFVLRIMS